jgi:anti-sigma B factor antagonist
LESVVRKLEEENRVSSKNKWFWWAVVGGLGIEVSRETREWLRLLPVPKEHDDLNEPKKVSLPQIVYVSQYFDVKKSGNVKILTFIHNVLHTDVDITQVGELLDSLIGDEGYTRFLLNYQNVKYHSSAMLAKLTKFKRKLDAVKGKVKLCCIQRDLRELFRITSLDILFEIYEDERTALRDF